MRAFLVRHRQSLLLAGVAFLGVAAIVIGAVIAPLARNIRKTQVKESLPLNDTSSALYPTFENLPNDTSSVRYMQFWMNDLINAESVRKGAKPKFRQLGPFTYREYEPKYNITWNEERTRIHYDQLTYYVYDAKMSAEPEDRLITTVNVPLLAIINMVVGEHKLIKDIVDIIFALFKHETYFVTHTAREWLWGYEDHLLSEIHKLVKSVDPMFDLQGNMTTESNTVFTGVDDYTRVTEFIKYQDSETMAPVWANKYANMINGTDAGQFPPFVTDDTKLPVFVDSIFRSGFLSYDSPGTVFGIDLKRFIIDRSLLANTSTDASSAGFYAFGPTGVLNLSSAEGAPIFVSKPFFLDADPSYAARIQDYPTPVREEHETYIEVEPITGATMKAQKRLQINCKIGEVKGIAVSAGVPQIMLPVFWVNESGALSESAATDFKAQVIAPVVAAETAQKALIAVGIILLVGVAAFMLYIRYRKAPPSEEKPPEDTAPLLQDGLN